MVSKLTKSQIVDLLTAHNVEGWSSKMTVSELRAVAAENIKKPETAAELKGLSKLKREDLTARAEELGVPNVENLTCDQLRLRIREAVLKRSEPQPGDLMMFGMFRDSSYVEVLSSQPKYARWCMDIARDDVEASWQLKRFAAWAAVQKVSPKKEGLAKPAVTMPVDASCNPKDGIEMVMKTILQRLDNLETQTPSSPSASAASAAQVPPTTPRKAAKRVTTESPSVEQSP